MNTTEEQIKAPLNILVIEDNPSHLKLAHHVLTAARYHVNDAEAAEQALAAIKADKPQLILMDLELPGMDGLTLVQKIKATSKRRTFKLSLSPPSRSAFRRRKRWPPAVWLTFPNRSTPALCPANWNN